LPTSSRTYWYACCAVMTVVATTGLL